MRALAKFWIYPQITQIFADSVLLFGAESQISLPNLR